MTLDNEPRNVPPGVPANLITPQGNMPAIGVPNSQDYPRLVFSAPYFETIPIAEIIQPSVTEAVENILPSLVPPYVDAAAQAAVQAQAVLLVGSTMSGPLFLSPVMPTQPAQAATMAYVDSMIATAGIPEVPPVPSGQVWARETGQWVPITPQTGVFLPLSGGAMTGNINMSGNTIQNMAAVPAMPNGAAPAQWVLNQIASVSLYQGTWDADTNVPDLTQLSTHVNAYTWIAITTSVDGVVIGPPIPGLQGMTVFNGDTIIYSTVQGGFMAIHAGGLSLPEADARYVQLGGSQMSGALLLNANASQPLQAVTLQQLQAFVPPGAVGEAPNDGQLYGRNGLTASWSPVLPLAGGILTGALTLAANATQPLQPATYGQMNSAISAAVAAYLPLAGAAMTGLMTLSGNASVGLNPVPLQQLTGMLATYVTTTQLNTALAGYLALTGGTLTGTLTSSGTNNHTFGAGGYIFSPGSGQINIQGLGAANTPLSQLLFWSALTSCSAVFQVGSYLEMSNSARLTSTGTTTVTLQTPGFAGGGGWAYSAADGSTEPFNWSSNASAVMLLGNTGNLNISGTLTQGSDETNKTNIAPLAQGIGLVRQLVPKSFAWAAAPDQTQWGFIAQDVDPVIPPAVTHSPSMGTLGLDTTAILAAVTYAVQQLDRRCTALEANASLTPPEAELA